MSINVGQVSVTINRAHLEARMDKATKKAGYALAAQVLADSNRLAPSSGGSVQSSGSLRGSGKVEPQPDGSFAVTWEGVYIPYQWYGCWPDGTHVIQNHTTPDTHTQWAEVAHQRHGKEWEKIAQKEHVEGGK